MLPWVRTAPFGRPDVPEVKRITAGSSSSRSTIPAFALAADGQLVVDDHVRRRGAHALLDLRRGEQDVQWHDDRAGAQGAEERGHVRGGVREPQRDAVARPDAAGGERGTPPR